MTELEFATTEKELESLTQEQAKVLSCVTALSDEIGTARTIIEQVEAALPKLLAERALGRRAAADEQIQALEKAKHTIWCNDLALQELAKMKFSLSYQMKVLDTRLYPLRTFKRTMEEIERTGFCRHPDDYRKKAVDVARLKEFDELLARVKVAK